MVKDLLCSTKSPLSTKERMETGIFKRFSRMWRTGARYKADKIGDRAEPCPTPTSTLKKDEEKLFQRYQVFLSTR